MDDAGADNCAGGPLASVEEKSVVAGRVGWTQRHKERHGKEHKERRGGSLVARCVWPKVPSREMSDA